MAVAQCAAPRVAYVVGPALATRTPYATLGYNPGDADSRNPTTGEWDGCHGTHVVPVPSQ